MRHDLFTHPTLQGHMRSAVLGPLYGARNGINTRGNDKMATADDWKAELRQGDSYTLFIDGVAISEG